MARARNTHPNSPSTPAPTANASGTNGDSHPVFNAEQQARLYQRVDSLIANELTMRQEWFRRTMDPRRSIDDECGYPQTITTEQYKAMYDRNPIAARVVEVLPKESWQVQPLVYEDPDPETVTPFEEGWDGLAKMLRGENCYYKEEEGSPVWEYLLRADILSGIGQYGVILLGFDDGLDLAQPVKGWKEEGTMPAKAYQTEEKAKGSQSLTGNSYTPQRYKLTVNETETKGRKLLYLRVFPEHLAQINRFESNTNSPRFGQPVSYNLTFNDPRSMSGMGIGLSNATRDVHWSRVIHVADLAHQAESSEVFAVPRCQPVANHLQNVEKIYGASAEGYWKSCFTGLSFETHPQLGGDVQINEAALKDMYERYINGLQRGILTRGMAVKPIAPSVVDPTPFIAVQIEAICIKLACPVRIFKGSERGELASNQDDASWNDRLWNREIFYVTPRLIVPLVDRLIAVGVLPAPRAQASEITGQDSAEPLTEVETDPETATEAIEAVANRSLQRFSPRPEKRVKRRKVRVRKMVYNFATAEQEPVIEEVEIEEESTAITTPAGYTIEWPDLTSQSDLEKAQVASAVMTALATYKQADLQAILPTINAYTDVLGWEEDKTREMLEEAERDQIAQEAEDMAKQQDLIDKGLAPDPTDPAQNQPPPFGGKPGGFPPKKGGPPKPSGGNPFTKNHAEIADNLVLLSQEYGLTAEEQEELNGRLENV